MIAPEIAAAARNGWLRATVLAKRLVRSRAAQLATVFCLSALPLFLLVGRGVLFHLDREAVGSNPASDFQIMTWSLAWWPWAIGHGLNPLHTRLLWPPVGFSTLWMTTVPAAAALALPLTLTAGPLVAYNVLMILAIPLASVAAYLLCRELAGRFLPALVGGLLFGLSPYMLGHTLSQHLDLVLVFPLPLVALFCIRYVRGKTSSLRFVAALALLLLLQLGFSLELFCDLTLVLGLGLLFAFIGGPASRSRLIRLIGLVALSYACLLPVLAAIATFALARSHGALTNPPTSYAIDLANLVIPTPTLLAGTLHGARAISLHFAGNIGEQDGYLGVPLIAVALGGLMLLWRRGAWLVGCLLVCTILFSLGPILTLDGRPLRSLPFALTRLPIFSQALPARLSIFTALGASVLAALLLGRLKPSWLAVGVAGLLVVSLAPNFRPAGRLLGAWPNSTDFSYATPRLSLGFVDDPLWQRLMAPGSTVLVLPTGDATSAGFWQAESDMRFALAVPGTPFVPPALLGEPVMQGLLSNHLARLEGTSLATARLRAYLRANHVAIVAVTHAGARRWQRLAALATATRPWIVGSTTLYRVPADLKPLHLTGERRIVRKPGAVLSAWLAFDGTRARVCVRYRSHPGRPAKVTILSAPSCRCRFAPCRARSKRPSGRSVHAVHHGRGPAAFRHACEGPLAHYDSRPQQRGHQQPEDGYPAWGCGAELDRRPRPDDDCADHRNCAWPRVARRHLR